MLKGTSGSSQSGEGGYVPATPVLAPTNEASVALRYISARYHARRTPNISHLRLELRQWLMSLDAETNAQIYHTIKNKMIPLRKILTGACGIDGSRGDGVPPWSSANQRVAEKVVHNGRVYVLDDRNTPRLGDEETMVVDRLADLLLDRLITKLDGSALEPRGSRQLVH